MGQVVPFAFEDRLVRTVMQEEEPWFVGADVCRALSIEKARNALDRLDADEKGARTVGTPGGPQEMIIISEPGVYRLVFTSRKPEAERFKRWLAHEVLPELRRRGFYGRAPEPEPITEDPTAVLQAKVAVINAAARVKGNAYAARLWDKIGLPAVPAADARASVDETARSALLALLSSEFDTGELVAPLRTALEMALAGTTATVTGRLAALGIVVDEKEEGFLLGHTAEVSDLFVALGQDFDGWKYLIRKLPGIRPGPKLRVGGRQVRTTFVPATWLDPAGSMVPGGG